MKTKLRKKKLSRRRRRTMLHKT